MRMMFGGLAANTGSDAQRHNRNKKRIGAVCAGEAGGASFPFPNYFKGTTNSNSASPT